MMKPLLGVITILIFLSNVLLAQDTKIILLLNSGRQVSGELLYVRDSSLVIRTDAVADSSGNNVLTESLIAVQNDSVAKVIIRREPIFVKAVTTGLLVGAATGALIGYAVGRDEPGGLRRWFVYDLNRSEAAVTGAIVLGGIGLGFGLIAGVATPSGDEELDIHSKEGRAMLLRIARYKQVEPEEIARIR